jgi:hypothetical protein
VPACSLAEARRPGYGDHVTLGTGLQRLLTVGAAVPRRGGARGRRCRRHIARGRADHPPPRHHLSGDRRPAPSPLRVPLSPWGRTRSQLIAISGETFAAEAAALGLFNEYRARVYPVLVGRGVPFFPQSERRVHLELVETCTFRSRVVKLRYGVER